MTPLPQSLLVKLVFKTHRPLRTLEKSGARKTLMEKDQIRKHLNTLHFHNSMEPDKINLQVLRELAKVIVRQLPIIFETLC